MHKNIKPNGAHEPHWREIHTYRKRLRLTGEAPPQCVIPKECLQAIAREDPNGYDKGDGEAG